MKTIKYRFIIKKGNKIKKTILTFFQFHRNSIKELLGEKDWAHLLFVNEFIGVCDKKKKEIFDQDIVRIWSDFYKSYSNEVVFWSDEYGWLHSYRDRPSKKMWEFAEVIGNIYENPELLEGKK